MLIESLAIIIGMYGLITGADKFISGASIFASKMSIPPMLIGLTVVSFGTSLPEMVVSATAAFNGDRNMGIGNAIGSNIANIGLVLGITAIITPLAVKSLTFKRDLPILLLITVLPFILMYDGTLTFTDGSILLFVFVIMMLWLYHLSKNGEMEDTSEIESSDMSKNESIKIFAIGLVLLIVGSKVAVWGAIGIAHYFGLSELIIGLTVVAIGTSLPELAASLTSAIKGNIDMAVGNIIGSNIFNTLAVLMMPALIHPGHFNISAEARDIPVMIGFTIALIVFSFGVKGGKISRIEGSVLLTAFASYMVLVAVQA